jgi:hypothetical protein
MTRVSASVNTVGSDSLLPSASSSDVAAAVPLAAEQQHGDARQLRPGARQRRVDVGALALGGEYLVFVERAHDAVHRGRRVGVHARRRQIAACQLERAQRQAAM